jgi:hypothetical protein
MAGFNNIAFPSPSKTLGERIYQSSTAAFVRLCIGFLIVEVGTVLVVTMYMAGGDAAYRYLTVGIPVLFAAVLPLLVTGVALLQSGQSVFVGPQGFAWQCGKRRFSTTWREAKCTLPERGRWWTVFKMAHKLSNESVTINSMFFPEFQALYADVDRYLNQARREKVQYEI